MKDLADDFDLAFWLTRSIGRSIGLNFCMAMEEGRLKLSEYEALIDRCRGCTRSASCTQWLAEAGGPKGADRAPDFCPNGPALHALKPH